MSITMTTGTAISSIDDALLALGAIPDPLDHRQRDALDRDGCIVLPGVIDPLLLEALRARHEELMAAKYGPVAPTTAATDLWNHEAGTRRLTDLVSEGVPYDALYTHPVHLAAVRRLIGGEFRVHSINARDALPGHGHQGFHRDGRITAGQIVNSAWLLDGFTADNGPTRVVPGSHRWDRQPHEAMADTATAHPGQIEVIAGPGSVLVFDGALWHSGTTNRSGRIRRVVHVAMARPHVGQVPVQRERIRKSTWERISPAARYLLDV
ncbi:MAG TPA: phytanoyl-CoA dioxygenase family protein [Planctomycetota bacterium]|nr:phytanoyl-CoA dioxygenase family protein [Planctomycetota bacterium]